MAAGKSLNAHDRYRERWHTSPAPHGHKVKPLLFVGPPAAGPDAPCFRCEARGECKHREVEGA